MKIGNQPTIQPYNPTAPKAAVAGKQGPAEIVDTASTNSAEPANTREVRINRFVKTLSRESLEHVRYLSSIYAGNMVGTTIGALVATPIGIHLANESPAIVGGVSIGGAIAGGALGSLVGYLYERRQDTKGYSEQTIMNKPGGIIDSAMALAAGVRSMPRFIYPSVYGADANEKETIYNALDKLPLKDATASSTMTVIPGLEKTGIGGMSQPLVGMTRIIFDQKNLNSPSFGPELVTHEQGHAVDYAGGWGLLGSLNWRGGFGKGPFVSTYASGNRYEDWAESYYHFHKDPTAFAADFPGKFKVLDEASRPTPFEGLMDHPKIRETGKHMADALATVPYARTALEVGASLLAPVMLRKGALELQEGMDKNDDARKLQGKMNLSAGVLMAMPGAGPLAIGSIVAQQALIRVAGDDPKRLELANSAANGVAALATGPFGMAALAVTQELAKSGVDLSKIDFTKAEEQHRIGAGKMLKGMIATVGGAVGGSLVGVSIGTALSGPEGAALGAVFGRIAGGAIGLGAYGAVQALKSEAHDTSPYDLTRSDKIFLTKVVGGAAVGAAAGTVAGTLGGAAAGGAIGQALGGVTGERVGNWLGGAAGTMLGAYALGKAGATLGRLGDKGDKA